jgi:replicative DNA helicase
VAYRQVIGSLMLNPLLFLEYTDISPTDFDITVARICFIIIKNLYGQGLQTLTPIEVDQEVDKHENSAIEYRKNGGLDFLKSAYEFAEPSNFDFYYNRLKKYSLLRRLQKDKYDISEFYIDDKDIEDPLMAVEIQERFDNATIEDILNSVEGKYNLIRNDYLNGGRKKGDPSEGIFELIENLQKAPNIGPSLEGKIFSSACRGAREGCFFLKSASTNAGKTRTSVFDACRLAFPVRWSHEQETFIEEVAGATGEFRQPRKVLFIVTEMDKEELQTIMLAYLSGVDEDKILRGKYDEFGELTRVKYAASIIQKYHEYFIIEEISDPNLTNIEATIRKYATVDEVKYVFFDYIHTTASMMSQFTKNGLREDVVLMLMANQLKQVAKDYNVFIFSATQVNAAAMSDDGEFKNEACIRGSKAVADKADMGYVMTRVSDKTWNSLVPTLRTAAREGLIDPAIIEDINMRPTHILDIYKMRRGRYKNVRIWSHIHLGTGYRKDLFITTADNQPISNFVDIFSSALEKPIHFWRDEVKEHANANNA